MYILSVLNPTVFIGNFEWREPVTTLTDFLVALVCWAAFYFFSQLKNSQSGAYPWFKKYFFVFAIGMTSAAWLGHGFQAYVATSYKAIGWMFGATGLMLLQMGSLTLIKANLSRRMLKILPKWFVLQWLIAIVCMVYFLSIGIEQAFKVTQINSVVALWGFVLPMHIFAYKKLAIQGSKIIIVALLYSAIPGIIYSQKVSLSNWFNYHDISHILMAIFMSIMFFGLYQLVKPVNS